MGTTAGEPGPRLQLKRLSWQLWTRVDDIDGCRDSREASVTVTWVSDISWSLVGERALLETYFEMRCIGWRGSGCEGRRRRLQSLSQALHQGAPGLSYYSYESRLGTCLPSPPGFRLHLV